MFGIGQDPNHIMNKILDYLLSSIILANKHAINFRFPVKMATVLKKWVELPEQAFKTSRPTISPITKRSTKSKVRRVFGPLGDLWVS